MKRFSFDGPFDLPLTVSCGQAFRWKEEEDGYWSAPVNGSVWEVRQKEDTLLYGGCSEEELIHYFALDLDLDEILSSIDTDPLIHKAITACRGLRICRQPPFECLISYICASCSNIPMIAKRIELLSETFGKQAGGKRFAFPTADVLAEHGMDEIRCCKTGYRDKFIHEASVYAAKNPHWIEQLSTIPYPDARSELMKLSGIGPKVADCVLLFGFAKYEALPVDVWIERIFRTQYFDGNKGKKLPYNTTAEFGRKHFGAFAGYAQEYLYAEREILSKRGE